MNHLKTLLIILIVTTITSCSNNSASSVVDPPVANGTWRINLYFDDTDETSDFAGYSFSFNTGGQVIATKGTVTKNGTWSETSSKFILDFGTDPLFQELNNDWLKMERTATSIKLKEDNPAQDDKLEFTKL